MSQTYKSGIGFIEVLKNDAEKKNFPIEYDLEVRAEELIMEDGRVIGVRAVSANGTPYEYKAGKGVVLATGGFGANVEMRVKYNSIWADLGPTVPDDQQSGDYWRRDCDGAGYGRESGRYG